MEIKIKQEIEFRKEQQQRETKFREEQQQCVFRNKKRLEELTYCINAGISPHDVI